MIDFVIDSECLSEAIILCDSLNVEILRVNVWQPYVSLTEIEVEVDDLKNLYWLGMKMGKIMEVHECKRNYALAH